jgi:leader peptidase (prepilin peptidase)/N-methyltransferase
MSNSLFTLFSFLLGLVLGSFLNVCIYRIPQRQSIVYPPSSCPECGRSIKFYDNIPVLSYIILLGKCRTCTKPIPIRYPVVELVTGLLSMALFMKFGPTPQYPLFFLFSAALLVVGFIDLQHQIIPDVISLPGILLGFAFSALGFTGLSWLDSFIGIVGGGGFLFAVAVLFERLTRKEGMGGGDVKLLAMIGAWMGWRALPFIILISSFAGTVIGGGSLLVSGRSYRTKIPFGPFLALAALIYLFFGTEFVSWYYQLFR